MMALLFLDFDGVLCVPFNGLMTRQLVHLPRLETLLREFPSVNIVISSNWRLGYSRAELSGFFSADIAPRIAGVTPDAHGGKRILEIEHYLKHRALPGEAWLALDDSPNEFPPSCPNLVLCDPTRGFDDEAAARLRVRLAGITGGTVDNQRTSG